MRPIELTWPGGEHAFLLNIEHLRAIQSKCNAGPGLIHSRLVTGAWLVDDVIQPVRFGLEGGGLDKEAARDLVNNIIEERPMAELVLTAANVLGLFLWGQDEDDEPGEFSERAEAENDLSQTSASDGQKSTSAEPLADLHQSRLTE